MDRSVSDLSAQGQETIRRLIYTNVAISLLVWLCDRLMSLLPWAWALESKLYFFPKLAVLLREPWRFVSYMWVHDGLMHLGVNMLVLWYVGGAFSARFGSRALVSLYLLSGVGGSLVYLLLYQGQTLLGWHAVPYGLIGSSAAIFGLLFGYAFYDMRARVRIPLLGRDAYIWLVVSLLTLLHILLLHQKLGGIGAHIGGIGTGLLFAWMLRDRGIDITRWLSALMDSVASRWRSYRSGQGGRGAKAQSRGREVAIDPRILDKVRSSGYSSLSAEERRQLQKTERESDDTP